MKTTPSKFKPFVLVTNDETKKCVITAGKYQVTPYEFENEKQAEDYIKTQPYDLMINLYAILRYAEENEKQNPQDA